MLAKRLCRLVAQDVLSPLKRETDYYRIKPGVATMFLTYRCTSKCKSCTAWKRDVATEAEVGLTDWCGISDSLSAAGVRNAELFGGDVFLRNDIVMPLIRHLKKNGFTVYIPTNANLIDKDIAAGLAKERVDVMYFSVDGVESVQDAVRGVQGSFRKVVRAVDLLKRLRTTTRTPRLICNTTVSNLNADKLFEIAQFASEVGFDAIYYEYVGEMTAEHIEKSRIGALTPTPFYVRQKESLLLNKDQAVELKSELERIKRSFADSALSVNSINIDTLSVENLFNGTIPNKRCYVARREVTIDPYGNVIACPVINNYIHGNLLEQNLSDVWNNKRHRIFREYQNSGRINLCGHCILGVQRNHSLLTAWKRKLLMNY
ncbi:MAG: radical SAM protein [Planctomycetota bacterium]|jgi:MoaA/NifB/PqqE/SkfB family radical SAM enzyme